MVAKIWQFEALDTLFFRDGTPHNAGEGGGTGIKSLFPPYMFTLQGAIRTALALGQGWRPGGSMPFPAELGDSDSFGKISFEGPYLINDKEYLFPVPLNLFYKRTEEDAMQFSYVLPGKKSYQTDMGGVRLPELKKPLKGAKSMQGFMIKRNSLQDLLNGKPFELSADDFDEKEYLWQNEERAGIAINRSSGTAQEQMLYFTSHVRTKQNLSIAVKVKGIDEKWHKKAPSTLSLGGEGRMVSVKVTDKEDILPFFPDFNTDKGTIKFTVILVTPGCIWPFSSIKETNEKMQDLIKKGFPDIPGKCVSACIGKMEQLGGFDLVRREPRPLLPIIPEGSIWFYEGKTEDIDILKELHGKITNPLGFNQIIIGKWGD
ncbi:MAG: hypothetical protein GX996_05345 [Firmicutes bacterium]|nr:hypothetical protein [Bacillota bacterium]